MKKQWLIGLFAAGFLFTYAAASAQEKDDPCGCGDDSSQSIEDRLECESIATWMKESAIAYETKDGNLYWWLGGYDERARKLAEAGDEKGLADYVREIAANYRFGSESDEEGFIRWVLTEKPWLRD